MEDDENALTPVITDDGYTFLYVKHNNLYLMAMSKRNSNAMVVMNFLYRIVEVFEDYFNELVEESIRDNFVITYELLDEMMDFGYPQSTEPKVRQNTPLLPVFSVFALCVAGWIRVLTTEGIEPNFGMPRIHRKRVADLIAKGQTGKWQPSIAR